MLTDKPKHHDPSQLKLATLIISDSKGICQGLGRLDWCKISSHSQRVGSRRKARSGVAPGSTMGKRQASGGSVMFWAMFC